MSQHLQAELPVSPDDRWGHIRSNVNSVSLDETHSVEKEFYGYRLQPVAISVDVLKSIAAYPQNQPGFRLIHVDWSEVDDQLAEPVTLGVHETFVNKLEAHLNHILNPDGIEVLFYLP